MRLLTWNVHHATPRADLIQAVPELIQENQIDVACLQEVDLTKFWVRAVARKLGYRAAMAIHPQPFKWWIEGVAILSRYPLIRVSRRSLDRRRSYLQVTTVDPELGAVNIGCVHTTNGCQELQIAKIQVRGPSAKTILAGDFNLTPGNAAIWTLSEDFNPDGCPDPTYPAARRKVDYVFTTPDLGVEARVIESELSDHQPLLATISPISGGG